MPKKRKPKSNNEEVKNDNTMLNDWLEASSLDILLAPCQTFHMQELQQNHPVDGKSKSETAEEKKKQQRAKPAQKKREKRYDIRFLLLILNEAFWKCFIL